MNTAMTLNDRFTLIKTTSFPTQTQATGRRSRSRSRSRGRIPQQQAQQQKRGGAVDLRGSKRNQKLLTQLERQHKMRIALKLKNVSCLQLIIVRETDDCYLQKSIMKTRGGVQGQAKIIRNRTTQAAAVKRAAKFRAALNRSNSLTTYVP
jgi:hypothetical protein